MRGICVGDCACGCVYAAWAVRRGDQPQAAVIAVKGGERRTEEGGMQQRVVKTHTNSPKRNQKRGQCFYSAINQVDKKGIVKGRADSERWVVVEVVVGGSKALYRPLSLSLSTACEPTDGRTERTAMIGKVDGAEHLSLLAFCLVGPSTAAYPTLVLQHSSLALLPVDPLSRIEPAVDLWRTPWITRRGRSMLDPIQLYLNTQQHRMLNLYRLPQMPAAHRRKTSLCR